jgi:broad specificity phosphatase PhoE
MIAIIRHGKAQHNFHSVYSGKTQAEGGADLPLIPGQEKEAQEVAQLLIQNGFEKAPIWCSPLRRTQDTARLLKEQGLKGEIHIKSNLRENNAGQLEGKSVANTEGLSMPDAWTAHMKHTHENGGESFEDVTNRMREIVEQLLNSNEKIVVVTHGTPSRALILLLTNGKTDICLDQWGVFFV